MYEAHRDTDDDTDFGVSMCMRTLRLLLLRRLLAVDVSFELHEFVTLAFLSRLLDGKFWRRVEFSRCGGRCLENARTSIATERHRACATESANEKENLFKQKKKCSKLHDKSN